MVLPLLYYLAFFLAARVWFELISLIVVNVAVFFIDILVGICIIDIALRHIKLDICLWFNFLYWKFFAQTKLQNLLVGSYWVNIINLASRTHTLKVNLTCICFNIGWAIPLSILYLGLTFHVSHVLKIILSLFLDFLDILKYGVPILIQLL